MGVQFPHASPTKGRVMVNTISFCGCGNKKDYRSKRCRNCFFESLPGKVRDIEKGIYWHKRDEAWYVSVTFNSKIHYGGKTKDKEQAKEMLKKLRERLSEKQNVKRSL